MSRAYGTVTSQYERRQVRNILLMQAIISIIFIGFSMAVAGFLGFQSACLACLTYWLPYICSLKITFRYQGARAARQIARSFYRGEALKIGLSIVLFTLVFTCFKLAPWIFFSVYIGMQLSIWLIPLIVK